MPYDSAMPISAGYCAPVASTMSTRPLGLYVHIPFCVRKCSYCDFNTYSGLEALHEAYVGALCREVSGAAERHGLRPVDSVFIGGGTPTVLSGEQLARVMGALRAGFQLLPGCEITVEANPGATDMSRFRQLADLGVNRLSLGAQSFQEDELRFLGRIHGVAELGRAVDAARAAGLERFNLDLIFGLPGQARATWRRSLDAALALEPEHLSLYSLIVEPETPLAQWVASGRVAAPDDDIAADHYLDAQERLAVAGYLHYEISNWTRRPSREVVLDEWSSPPGASRHNLRYWRNEDYLGFGPGAHSCLHRPASEGKAHQARRWWNLKSVPEYIRRLGVGEDVEDASETVVGAQAMGESMMLGLRLIREGLSWESFRRLHGVDAREAYAPVLSQLDSWGMVERSSSALRLSARGIPLGNQVFGRFLP